MSTHWNILFFLAFTFILFVKQVLLNFRKEYKLFIGGSFKRSDNGTIKYDENIFIPSAIESDVHNAVSSAVAAQSKYNSFQHY